MSADSGNAGIAARPALWIGAIIVVALATGYLFRPQGMRGEEELRSSFRTTPDGVAALARGIERLGRPTAQRITPLVAADPVRGTIALLEPPLVPSPREVRALLDMVREGGTLIYAPPHRFDQTGRPAATPLMDSLGVTLRPRRGRELLSDRSLANPRWRPHALTAGLPPPFPPVHGVRVRGRPAPDSSGADRVERLLAAEGPQGVEWTGAAALALGEGRVVVFSEARALANERVANNPLAVLAVRAVLAHTAPADTVFFDEFHQGVRGERTRAEVLGDFFLGSPGGRTLLHLIAVCLLVLACAGVRFGAPAPAVAPPDRERRSPLEHVSALGDLYRKAGAANTAALLLLARLARSARRPPPRNTAEADALLRGLDTSEGADTPLARARSGLEATPPDLAAVAAGIDQHLAAR